MITNAVFLSNLLNAISKSSNDVRFYMAGYPVETIQNRVNDSDPTGTIGIQYPLVQWVLPVNASTLLSETSTRETYNVQLLIAVPKDANDNGTLQSTVTHLERIDRLGAIAAHILKCFRQLRRIKVPVSLVGAASASSVTDRDADMLAQLVLTFQVQINGTCRLLTPEQLAAIDVLANEQSKVDDNESVAL